MKDLNGISLKMVTKGTMEEGENNTKGELCYGALQINPSVKNCCAQ